MIKDKTQIKDKGVQAAYKQLQYAKAHLAESRFQFDTAESNVRAAERDFWAAEKAFEEATNELFEKTRGGELVGEAA